MNGLMRAVERVFCTLVVTDGAETVIGWSRYLTAQSGRYYAKVGGTAGNPVPVFRGFFVFLGGLCLFLQDDGECRGSVICLINK